ncbi:MAG: hypothetical protein Q4G40_08560 [Brachybacterium sp.]|nr:hypothetical protein [Brachybacterium sp.]
MTQDFDEGPVPADQFSSALRDAISRSGLTLSRLRDRLAHHGVVVSVASLSSWQSGHRHPERESSLDAVAALEDILGEEPGSLQGLLGPARVSKRPLNKDDLDLWVPRQGGAREALVALGFTRSEDLPHEIFVHEFVQVDLVTGDLTITMQIMVRALQDGPCRFPSIHVFDEPGPVVEPSFTPIYGCEIDARLHLPHKRTFGAAVCVDGPMEAGQLAMFSFRIDLVTDPMTVDAIEYAVLRRARDVFLEVEFTGTRHGVDAVRYLHERKERQESPVRLDVRNRIQNSASSFGPGRVGLRWGWPTME